MTSLETNILSRADGSANFCLGSVSASASVNGPIEVRIRDELPDKATLEVNVLPLRGLPGPSSRSTAVAITKALSPLILLYLHPRSLIQLTIQTLTRPSTRFSRPFNTFDALSQPSEGDSAIHSPSNDAGESMTQLASSFNAATCALLHAGINMKSVAFAVSASLVNANDEGSDVGMNADLESSDKENIIEYKGFPNKQSKLIIYPSPQQEQNAVMSIVAAFSFQYTPQQQSTSEPTVTPILIQSTGSLAPRDFVKVLDVLRTHANMLRDSTRGIFQESINQLLYGSTT